MFVRKKRNKSSSVSVQIVDKTNGYRVAQTVGSSKNQEEIGLFVKKAQYIIRTCGGKQGELFLFQTSEETAVRRFL